MGEDERLPIEYVKEAVVQGGKTRLRPVLLTAITTVLGLLPLATGMNINFITLFTELDPEIYFGGDNAIFFRSDVMDDHFWSDFCNILDLGHCTGYVLS